MKPPLVSRADATRVTRDAPRRGVGRYFRNPFAAPRAGVAGTRGPTATRVPAFARLAGTVEGANERVVHGMFTREEAGAARVALAGRFSREA